MNLFQTINKSILLLLCATTGIACKSSADVVKPDAQSIVLAQSGATRYVIALANDAIPAEQTAATELQKYVREMSGATLPIQNESQVTVSQPQILIGAGLRAKKLAIGVKWESLSTDGIVIKTVGKNLVLAGGRPRGALYAVNTLLENSLGVRWWAPNETTVPKQSTIRLTPQNVVYVPQISMREVEENGAQKDTELATRLKLNGHFNQQGPNLGGHNSILGFVHTFARLLPTDKYFYAHPEWFSDTNNENKPCTWQSKLPSPGNWQLNLTNEAARLELTKNALEWIRENPEAGMISISQNDGPPACNTPEENALAASEGSPSGPLLKFVNQVAADIEKQYPYIIVETLAYTHTRKPPRTIRPRHNVVIRLCSIEADFSKPLDSEANKAFRADVMEWKKLSPRLLIWDYVTNFANVVLPYPNMNVLGPNVKFFADNGVVGLFEQGNLYSNGVGDFDAMRSWILAHMMWDPSLDDKKLRSEFLDGYYGPAAPDLSRYIDLMQAAFLKSGGYLGFEQRDISFLTLDVMNQATRYFQSAETAVAGNVVLARRVRRERMALDHAWLLRYKRLREEATDRKVAFDGPKDIVAFTNAFVQAGKEFGIKQMALTGTFDERAAQLVAMAQDESRPKASLPDFLRGVESKDVCDIAPSAMRLIAAKVVDDPISLTGNAAQSPGDTSEWGIQYRISPEDKVVNGKWRCYVLARVDALDTATGGVAMRYGVQADKAQKLLFNGAVAPEGFTKGQYTLFDLGTHVWNTDMYVWIATTSRAPEISNVYVSRILFVRDKEQ